MVINILRGAAFGAIALLAGAQTAAAFELSSPDLQAGKPIPQEFVLKGLGCTGANVSPAVAWRDAPAGTKSFALFAHDPDAKTGGAGFWHWVVVDIPAGAGGLAKNSGTADGRALPVGATQVATDFGAPGWGGPCPPSGDSAHRYNFTVYALKVDKLPLPPNPTASLAGFIANANAIGSATFTATYAH